MVLRSGTLWDTNPEAARHRRGAESFQTKPTFDIDHDGVTGWMLILFR
jgi:hypothetical protein